MKTFHIIETFYIVETNNRIENYNPSTYGFISFSLKTRSHYCKPSLLPFSQERVRVIPVGTESGSIESQSKTLKRGLDEVGLTDLNELISERS